MPQDLVFLDVEASSLGPRSYPIEIGWARLDPAGAISVDAVMIRPEPAWDDWDKAAEKVHGIQMGELYSNGLPAREAIARIVAALAGETVHSDSERDLTWCRVLFELKGRGNPFRWRHTDTLWINYSHMISDVAYEVATRLVDRAGPVIHRAGPDAARHAVFYALAKGINAELGKTAAPGAGDRAGDFARAEAAGQRLIEPYMSLLRAEGAKGFVPCMSP